MGGAQLTFIARKASMPTPPVDPQALLAYAQQHPGKISYPRPPDFTGTAFLEQLLMTLTAHPEALQKAPIAPLPRSRPALGLSGHASPAAVARRKDFPLLLHGWMPCLPAAA